MLKWSEIPLVDDINAGKRWNINDIAVFREEKAYNS